MDKETLETPNDTSLNTDDLQDSNVLAELDQEEEEEELTASKVLQYVENAWLNEKFAPEILPHKMDYVECLLQQIKHMEDNIRRLSPGDLRIIIHQMELDRIRYIIASYLRLRLEKIERYVIHILSEESRRNSEQEGYLTPAELKFAKEYLSSVETLFKTVALQHMPQNFQEFEIEKFTVKPNLNAHVFLRANKAVEGVVIPGIVDEEVDLEPGSQHIIQYRAVAELVKKGVVQLI